MPAPRASATGRVRSHRDDDVILLLLDEPRDTALGDGEGGISMPYEREPPIRVNPPVPSGAAQQNRSSRAACPRRHPFPSPGPTPARERTPDPHPTNPGLRQSSRFRKSGRRFRKRNGHWARISADEALVCRHTSACPVRCAPGRGRRGRARGHARRGGSPPPDRRHPESDPTGLIAPRQRFSTSSLTGASARQPPAGSAARKIEHRGLGVLLVQGDAHARREAHRHRQQGGRAQVRLARYAAEGDLGDRRRLTLHLHRLGDLAQARRRLAGADALAAQHPVAVARGGRAGLGRDLRCPLRRRRLGGGRLRPDGRRRSARPIRVAAATRIAGRPERRRRGDMARWAAQ